MSNIVRSFIEEFVPGWASRHAIRRAAEPAIAGESAARRMAWLSLIHI